MSRPRHRLTALALLALLSVPAAWGRQPQRRGAAGPPTPSARLLVLLSGWLGRTLPEDWLKVGCKIDPAGHCLPGTTADNGCMVDPNGSCAASTNADNGCMIDPAGDCAPGH